jgi:hypothetical protein
MLPNAYNNYSSQTAEVLVSLAIGHALIGTGFLATFYKDDNWPSLRTGHIPQNSARIVLSGFHRRPGRLADFLGTQLMRHG